MSALPGLDSFRPTFKEAATALRIAPGEHTSGAAVVGASSLEAQQLAAVQDVRSAPNTRVAAQWRAGTAMPSVDEQPTSVEGTTCI